MPFLGVQVLALRVNLMRALEVAQPPRLPAEARCGFGFGRLEERLTSSVSAMEVLEEPRLEDKVSF